MKIDSRAKNHILYYIVGFIILLSVALVTVHFLNLTGSIPWGSDTNGHLYKAQRLYETLKEGQWFLNYDAYWYNGIQPFRYWAPVPYYIIGLFNFFVEDIQRAYDLFLVFIFVFGGIAFVLWGKDLKRPKLGILLGILWFFVTNNIRVLYAEGNLPFVMVTTCAPYIFLFYIRALHRPRRKDLILLALMMAFITVNHAMLTAMTGITLFLYGLIWALQNKAYKNVIRALSCAAIGIFLMSFWLLPAFKGGIMSLTSEAAIEVMKSLSYPISISLNVFKRIGQLDIYYFGLAFAFVMLFGLIFTYKKNQVPYWVATIIFIGTTPIVLPILSKLPFGQLLWMYRFTSLAMCMIFIGILMWKNLRKSLLYFMICLVAIDSFSNYALLGHKTELAPELKEALESAIDVTSSRVALLDLSRSDSYPSYYFVYNEQNKRVKQVYGWAWQGAATSENIVTLNTALEESFYGILFDRALEIGADTLIIPENLIKKPEEMRYWASKVGYELIAQNNSYRIYKYPIYESYGTKATYSGLLIGDKSKNLEYLFPICIKGESDYIDDYTVEMLTEYEAIFLSGYKWHNRSKAEELIKEAARKGTKVVLDTVGQSNPLFDVSIQPIAIKEGLGTLHYKGKKISPTKLPLGYEDFRVNFIAQDLQEQEENYTVVESQKLNYVYEHEPNIYTLALNLPYYAYLTKDKDVLFILEDLLGLEAYELPKRKVVPITIEEETLHIKAEVGTIIPIAYLDVLSSTNEEIGIEEKNNLIVLKQAEVTLEVEDTTSVIGWCGSITAFIMLIGLVWWGKGKEEIDKLREGDVFDI